MAALRLAESLTHASSSSDAGPWRSLKRASGLGGAALAGHDARDRHGARGALVMASIMARYCSISQPCTSMAALAQAATQAPQPTQATGLT